MMLELETAELAKKHDLIREIVPSDSSCGAESLSCAFFGGKALSKKNCKFRACSLSVLVMGVNDGGLMKSE
jgi:hypothetical protein